jgi:hypothetical protein
LCCHHRLPDTRIQIKQLQCTQQPWLTDQIIVTADLKAVILWNIKQCMQSGEWFVRVANISKFEKLEKWQTGEFQLKWHLLCGTKTIEMSRK